MNCSFVGYNKQIVLKTRCVYWNKKEKLSF